MDAGRGRTQCTAQRARVENVKLCSFYAALRGKKFYSRRASCASAEGDRNGLVWKSKKVAMLPNRSPTTACCGSLRMGSLFSALRAILVLLNAVMNQVPRSRCGFASFQTVANCTVQDRQSFAAGGTLTS